MTPINRLRMVSTTLAKTLAGRGSAGPPRTGFLTMDATRRLLPLVSTDPKAFEVPVVGIWVAGVASVHATYVWGAVVKVSGGVFFFFFFYCLLVFCKWAFADAEFDRTRKPSPPPNPPHTLSRTHTLSGSTCTTRRWRSGCGVAATGRADPRFSW